MASAGKESFKQDLVVSIRYRNELPPPPMPPKFLDIDTGGISQYLTTSYASSLARREEPNIDVDAEGGMPIDMIGIPGYFLGDESAIMAPDTAPLLDPADQALMMSVDQLKSQGARNNVSFLRKNQYLSSQNARMGEPLKASTPKPKAMNRKPTAQDRNDKETIKKHIQKGFDIAYPDSIPYNPPESRSQPSNDAERRAWREPRHPDNHRAKPVAIYPVLPDLETGTDAANWGRVKFEKPPVAAFHGKRDDRIDSALFMAVPNHEAEAIWQRKKDAFDRDPRNYEDPGPSPPYTYVMTLPQNSEQASLVRRVLFAGHPDASDSSIRDQIFEETEDGTLRIPFNRARIYPTVQQTAIAANRFMALGLYNPDSPNNTIPPSKEKRAQGTAAYFYPISENLRFKTDRSKLSKPSRPEGEEEVYIDRMMVGLTEPNVNQLSERTLFRGKFDDRFKDEWERLEGEAMKWRDELEKEQGQGQDVEMEGAAGEGRVNGDGEGREVQGREMLSRQSVEADGDADAMDDE